VTIKSAPAPADRRLATALLPVAVEAGQSRMNLLGSSRADLMAYFKSLQQTSFRSSQVLKWVHQHGVADFQAMTNLAKSLRQQLSEDAQIRAPEIVREQLSGDGTRKWLLRVDAGNCIETVFIPEPGRGTLCISSQVGCALNCRFCSTAQQGFNRNLSSAEIIGQLWLANRALDDAQTDRKAITNVVLMGMGEPLLNFDAVIQALDIMLDDFAYGLAKRRVTLSTAGHVPGIDRLAKRQPVALAVSLHAPNDALRDTLVPLNKTYPIAQLLAACRRYLEQDPRQRITFEYVMLDGVNDHLSHANQLVRQLANIPSKVNLIPFNPFPGSNFRCSPAARIRDFQAALQEKGLLCMTRKTRGDDIDAACGQLAGDIIPKSARVRLQRAHQEVTSR